MKYLPIISCFLLVFCYGCKNDNSKSENKVREFVNEWNDAHTQIQSPYLAQNYMDVVNYYGKEYTKFQVQQDKNLLFQQFPDYTQKIIDQIEVKKVGGNFLVTFTKLVSYDDVESDYKSFLSITTRNSVFKILREGVDNNNLDSPIFPRSRERETFLTNKRQLFGDFNGDGLSDYVSVISPEIINTNTDDKNNSTVNCEGDCDSTIIFSNESIEDIVVKGSYKSQLVNLNDLNSDNADEIGYWDIKPTTKTLYVFNAINGELICKPIEINTAVHKNLKLIDVFKKTGPNKIKITFSEKTDGKWILKSEEIKL